MTSPVDGSQVPIAAVSGVGLAALGTLPELHLGSIPRCAFAASRLAGYTAPIFSVPLVTSPQMDIPYPTVGLSFITEKRVGLMDDWLRRERFVFLGWSGNGNFTVL